jgi:hypothetical protein
MLQYLQEASNGYLYYNWRLSGSKSLERQRLPEQLLPSHVDNAPIGRGGLVPLWKKNGVQLMTTRIEGKCGWVERGDSYSHASWANVVAFGRAVRSCSTPSSVPCSAVNPLQPPPLPGYAVDLFVARPASFYENYVVYPIVELKVYHGSVFFPLAPEPTGFSGPHQS